MKELFKDRYINDEVKTILYVTAIIKLALTTSEELTSTCGDKIETNVPCFRHVNLLLLGIVTLL